MSGTGLGDLPPVLLLDILKRIPTSRHSYNRVYHGLCLIKPLHHTATELLYTNGASHDIDHTKLLWTVLQRPELGRLVRTIALCRLGKPPKQITLFGAN
jgi:hypothetical protein